MDVRSKMGHRVDGILEHLRPLEFRRGCLEQRNRFELYAYIEDEKKGKIQQTLWIISVTRDRAADGDRTARDPKIRWGCVRLDDDRSVREMRSILNVNP